jgi:hypothetical protein
VLFMTDDFLVGDGSAAAADGGDVLLFGCGFWVGDSVEDELSPSEENCLPSAVMKEKTKSR